MILFYKYFIKFLLSSLKDNTVTCESVFGKYMSDVRHFLTVNGNAALLDGSSSLGTGCYKSGFYKKADQCSLAEIERTSWLAM